MFVGNPVPKAFRVTELVLNCSREMGCLVIPFFTEAQLYMENPGAAKRFIAIRAQNASSGPERGRKHRQSQLIR